MFCLFRNNIKFKAGRKILKSKVLLKIQGKDNCIYFFLMVKKYC